MPNLSLRYKMYKPCRLCLDRRMQTINLFDKFNTTECSSLEIVAAIEKIFSFKITPTERLIYICGKCMRSVKEFSDFFDLVIKAQIYLSKNAADYKGTFTYQPPNIEPTEDVKPITFVNVIDEKNIETLPILTEVKEESLNERQLETNVPDNLEEDVLNNVAADEQIDIKLEFCRETIDIDFVDNQLKTESVDNLILKNEAGDINNDVLLSTSQSQNTSVATSEVPSQVIPTANNQLTAMPDVLEETVQVDPDGQEVERSVEPVKLFENGSLIMTGDRLNDAICKFYDVRCQICLHKPTFKYLRDLFKHLELTHNTRGHVTCCDKQYYTRKGLTHHMAYHMQKDAFRCNICKKDHGNKESLKAHLLKHLPESERPHKCDQCDKSFLASASLETHKQTHLPVEQRRPCKSKRQDKLIRSGETKDLHAESEESSKQFLCPTCGRCFGTIYCLNSHVVSHDKKGENSVQCKQCGAILKTAGNLRTHLKIHNGKRLRCTECSYTTCTKSRLSRHTKIKHNDIKPHACKFCDKKFKLKSYLILHLCQHTGEKRYSCTYCPKTFVSSGNLSSHRKNMHLELYTRDMKRKQEEKLRNMKSRKTYFDMKNPVEAQHVHEEIKKLKVHEERKRLILE